MGLEFTVLILSGIGLYASAFMARKAARDARGELHEASVVQTPAARLLGGVPNAVFGMAFYPLVAIGYTLGSSNRTALLITLIGATLAALMSVYLGYSLLFVTKRECPYCWTAHVCNWTLWTLTFLAFAK